MKKKYQPTDSQRASMRMLAVGNDSSRKLNTRSEASGVDIAPVLFRLRCRGLSQDKSRYYTIDMEGWRYSSTKGALITDSRQLYGS